MGNNRILVVVFDGLQPAQITPELMPNLADFARSGVTFANHHPVFPTVTRVNASSLVTGRAPGEHGLAGNTFLCRDYDPNQVIPAMEPTLQAIADATGQPILVPTLADILHGHGMQYVAIGTGTSGNAYVHNPNAATSGGATIHPDFTLPRPLHAELQDRFGEWPDEILPNTGRLAHARRILTEFVLPEVDPDVALLWLSEPDKTQHADGVGLGRAPQALRGADEEFGAVLNWLDQNERSDTTDIFIASDHGYSTIIDTVPIESMMRESGFPTIDREGGVAVAGNGGSALFYVHRSDPATAEAVAQWLTSHEWCGALLASQQVGRPSGTLPASLIGCDGPRSPDLSMSFRWDSTPNEIGYEGSAYATGGRAGQGQHGSMSRHELRNIGLARGPSLRSGAVVDTPTGNIDLVPTILHLLGLDHTGQPLDGRVIEEALATEPAASPTPWITTHEAGVGEYVQRIQISHVRGSQYLDWGNRV